MKTKFNAWLIESKDKITRPDKYSSTVTTISNHFKKELNEDVDFYNLTSATEVLHLKEEYFSYNQYFEKNKTGNNMYSRSLDLYIEFLESNSLQIDPVVNEIDKINNDTGLSSREKETVILSRIGQGQFRDQLIKLWNSCVISKFDDPRFLIASHIKPWKKSTNQEKIDKYNGLLLLPTYDKLFDLGFISFENNGNIIISKSLIDYDKLGLNKNISIDIKKGNEKYLDYHRQEILKK